MGRIDSALSMYITLVIIISIIASLSYLYGVGLLALGTSSKNLISEKIGEFPSSYPDSGFRNLQDYKDFKPVKPIFAGKPGNTSVGFAMPAGYLRPSEKVSVKLGVFRPKYYDYDYLFIVKLYRLMENGDLILINATSMDVGRISFVLPKDEGVKYLLAVEAWKEDILVDLIYSLIVVPEQYVDAKIYLDKREYRTGDDLVYTIVNTGGDPIIFGVCYEIYRWDGERWVLDRGLTPKICPLVGIILEKGESRSFTISLEGAEPGLYKILVEVRGETTDIKKILESEFIVKEY